MWAVNGQTCFPRYLTGGENDGKRMGITVRKRRSVQRISTVIYRFYVVFVDGDLSKLTKHHQEIYKFPKMNLYSTPLSKYILLVVNAPFHKEKKTQFDVI